MTILPSRRAAAAAVAPSDARSSTSSTSAQEELAILTAARVVCRERLPVGGDVLTHVEKLIDGYLDTFSIRISLHTACFDGVSVRALEYLYARSSLNVRTLAAHHAAAAGHLHVIRWFVENHRSYFSNLRDGCLSPIDRAAQFGHLDAVIWLYTNVDEGCSSSTLDLAAQCGQVEVLRWLHKNTSEVCSGAAMVDAAAHNKVGTVKWLYRHGYHENAHAAILSAAEHGHVPVVKWLCKQGRNDDALRCGQLDVVKWLCKRMIQLELDGESYNCRVALQLATSQSHGHVVAWLAKMLVRQTLRHDEQRRRRRAKRTRGESSTERNTRARLE
ncbi:hypothetical protein PHYBOEH_010880 [Phytophthora boehmeriae]|uniref:Ankyrin repeat-containing domain n=1 Tax=Phytophthora boehmeriae TaxID=109152 RepID=A0A8T1VMY2_9STRA|nr:hypothetical protein PHYBOEH_010880 [Phytophthora boehmeriae]